MGPPGPNAVSANAGNDITLGSDTLVYFDHDTKYTDHVPKFATAAARDAAIPAPVLGQLAVVGDPPTLQMYRAEGWGSSGETRRRFQTWRTANYGIGPDSVWNDIQWDARDDPYNMLATSTTFTAPVAGVVLFSAMLDFRMTGTAAFYDLAFGLHTAGGDVFRGSAVGGANSNNNPNHSMTLCTAVPVTAGSTWNIKLFVAAPGASKTVTGGKQLTQWNGVYLST
jgi:hypothetical protein